MGIYIRRPLFWLVTLLAAAIAIDTAITFVGTFAHPVRFGSEIACVIGIWLSFFVVLRLLQQARGHVADTVLIQISDSAAVCCILGYCLAPLRP